MIEKRNFRQNLKGPDHKFSLNLDEFSDFVQKMKYRKNFKSKKLTKSKNEKKIQLMAIKRIELKKS